MHIITSLDTGGAEKMLFKLLSGMDRQRFESRVICLIPFGPVEKEITRLGIAVETLELKRGRISPLGVFRLLKMIKEWQPDIIQTWLYHADLLGYFAAKLAGFKNLIWNIRCTRMDLENYSRLTTWTVKVCAFFSNYPVTILANSDFAKEYHIQTYGYHSKNFKTILNGFDLSVFKPDKEAGRRIRRELDISDDMICSGLIGRYDPQKGHQSFIKAVQLVIQKLPDMVFIMAGRGMNHDNLEIKTLLKEMKLENHFKLLGERTDIPDIMNAMDFYCSASIGEGFPNVVGEAMACGLPCVVTDVGQSAAIVDDTGFVVPPEDIEVLAQGIVKLASLSENEKYQLGRLARKRVEKNYSLGKIVQQYEDLYSTVANSN